MGITAALLLSAAGSAFAARAPRVELQPAERILVGPLGFAPPSRFYMPYRIPAATLDFLDADHLLFTFHESALMRRLPNDPADDQDQTVRAIVLSVPGGKMLAQTEWRLHDRARYLWMLDNGHFLLRMRNTLLIGDPSLVTKPYLNPEGTLVSVQLSPQAKTLVAEYAVPEPQASGGDAPEVNAPTLGPDAPRLSSTPPKQYTMLVVNTQTSTAKRFGALPNALLVPMVEGGYLLSQQDGAKLWSVLLAPFTGAPRVAATVTSTCRPELHPLSENAFLTESCLPFNDDRLVQAWDLGGHKLWEKLWQSRFTWGTFAYNDSGTRFAYGTVEIDHSLEALDEIDPASILGQPVGVFDVENGNLTTVLGADPVLTAGQNFALSPDGDELAILRDGAIELYKMPPAPALQTAAATAPKRAR